MKCFSGVGSADDLVSPELRHAVARRAKEEVDIETARTRTRHSGTVVEAVQSGGLPQAADGTSHHPKPKGKGKEKAGPAGGK